MINSWIDDLFNFSPEDLEKKNEFEKKQQIEKQKKIEMAIKAENLKFSLREYDKKIEGGKSRQRFILFLCTQKGINGDQETLGKIDFSLHEKVSLEDTFICAKKENRSICGHLDKLLHLDLIIIFRNYRGYGLSHKLLSHFFNLYEEKYNEYPISVEFTNPISEYAVQKVLKEKGTNNILSEKLIQRYYSDTDDIALINLLKEKNKELFSFENTLI
ncbi:hypothetical protein AAGG74_17535 [Bacillus mexicanus]|uniref:hypothetical protein n=1 Tax=Bacillus mexicanus TaxID=2834415 RepID=UPI003D1E35F2